jgi:four helix bundle protein
MQTHKDLDVWKESMALAKQIYLLTAKFPKEETYGLISQIRRSAVSIPSNIAEGAARNSTKEFIQFLYVSLGSLAELETQLLLSKEIGIVEYSKFEDWPNKVFEKKSFLKGYCRLLVTRRSSLITHYTLPFTDHAILNYGVTLGTLNTIRRRGGYGSTKFAQS